MTNRDVVKPETKAEPAKAGSQRPNEMPLPAMPADEDSRTPTTNEEPIDSPQPNRSAKRAPPGKDEIGLATPRKG